MYDGAEQYAPKSPSLCTKVSYYDVQMMHICHVVW